MDEIWVPTLFAKEVFAKSGVLEEKIFVVGEPVDVDVYDPSKVNALLPPKVRNETRFLSVFKWEKRKAWDILLEAYFSEFTSEDNVILYLVTSPFHHDSEKSFDEIIRDFVKEKFGNRTVASTPKIVLMSNIPAVNMPKLYKSIDCFVLPSRGEGWGRPHVEASK